MARSRQLIPGPASATYLSSATPCHGTRSDYSAVVKVRSPRKSADAPCDETSESHEALIHTGPSPKCRRTGEAHPIRRQPYVSAGQPGALDNPARRRQRRLDEVSVHQTVDTHRDPLWDMNSGTLEERRTPFPSCNGSDSLSPPECCPKRSGHAGRVLRV